VLLYKQSTNTCGAEEVGHSRHPSATDLVSSSATTTTSSVRTSTGSPKARASESCAPPGKLRA